MIKIQKVGLINFVTFFVVVVDLNIWPASSSGRADTALQPLLVLPCDETFKLNTFFPQIHGKD